MHFYSFIRFSFNQRLVVGLSQITIKIPIFVPVLIFSDFSDFLYNSTTIIIFRRTLLVLRVEDELLASLIIVISSLDLSVNYINELVNVHIFNSSLTVQVFIEQDNDESVIPLIIHHLNISLMFKTVHVKKNSAGKRYRFIKSPSRQDRRLCSEYSLGVLKHIFHNQQVLVYAAKLIDIFEIFEEQRPMLA